MDRVKLLAKGYVGNYIQHIGLYPFISCIARLLFNVYTGDMKPRLLVSYCRKPCSAIQIKDFH